MKATIIAVIISLALIGGAAMLSKSSPETENPTGPTNNVSVVDGTQIIEITARGGYQPRTSVAKAGLPTILRFKTSGTFDCSASVRIPSLGVSKILPQAGATDIDVGTYQLATLKGSCGMGMYPFEVKFQ